MRLRTTVVAMECDGGPLRVVEGREEDEKWFLFVNQKGCLP